MAIRDVTVTVTIDENDWRLLQDAADCAGMTVQAYIGWNTKLLAQQSGPAVAEVRHQRSPSRSRRIPVVVDETEEQAWESSFTERLSHRADLYREP